MAKLLLSILLVFGLSGCASQLNNDWLHGLINNDAKPAKFNFDWQLTGDADLLPLQVFDNGNKLWLQYPEDTISPAFFARSKAGDILLKPKRDGQFLVLDSIPNEIVIQGGLQKAQIIKSSSASTNLSVKEQIATVYGLDELPISLITEDPTTKSSDTVLTNNKPEPVSKNNIAKKVVSKDKKYIKTKNLIPALPKLSVIPKEYSVSPKDINIRHALKTWSSNSEWTFSDDHWSVDVDIPIAGSASFGDSFQLAVRELLAATELGDRPLQPCFYSNKVLRVVPMAQRCDRTSNIGVSL